MMGLLDMFGSSTEDPHAVAMARLQLASGLLGAPKGGGMQGLLAGMQGYTGTMAQAKEAERRKRLEEEQRAAMMEERNLRMEQLRGAMAEQAQQRQQAATDMGLLRTQLGEQAGPTQNGMPVQSGAFDPRMMLAQGGSLPGVMQGLQLNQALTPQAPKRDIREVNGALVDITNPDAVRNLYTAPPKPAEQPSDVRAYEYAKAQGYQGSYLDFQLAQKRAGATNVTLPKIEVKTGESLAGQIGPMLKGSREQAEAGMRLVDSSQRVLQAAQSGNLFAGPGANLLLKGAQVADVLGLGGKTTQEKISNTRNVVRGMAEQAVSARAQLGGQAQISNSEQEMLNKATSGDISELTAGEIVQIAQLNDRLGRMLYGNHQRQLGVMRSNPDLAGLSQFYSVPELPNGANKPAANRGPRPGAVEGGYRFKGGDPADPKNWERV